MISKTTSKRVLLAIVLVGVVLIGFIVSQTLLSSLTHQLPRQSGFVPPANHSVIIQNPAQIITGLPVRLTIPAIKVDSAVQPVGITPDGFMDTTKGPGEVGWYKFGQHPGENGSAVMTGHYGWKNGIAAAFDNLSKLIIGDKLYSEDEKGVTTTFVVRELKRYEQNQDATSIFRSGDGKAHLNLITCEGAWSNVTKTYSNRLVVFADKQ